jgi:RimJ/RimL family protein N-acetyltransferase
MITGERIYLRAWEKTDVEVFYCWFNDPEVTVNIGSAYPAWSMDDEQRVYDQKREDVQRYAIVLKAGDALIGSCSLHAIDPKHRSAELGIVIGAKDHWNQGYGREAIGLLLEIGFEGLGLERIGLRHYDFNQRGHRCYVASGFVDEGRLRHERFIKGAFHDTIIMSILSHEYFARTRN